MAHSATGVPPTTHAVSAPLDSFLTFLKWAGILLVVAIVASNVYAWIYNYVCREMAKSEAEARRPLYSQLCDRSLYGNLGDLPDPTGEFEFTRQKCEAMDRRRLTEFQLHREHLKRTSIFDGVVSLAAGGVVAVGLYGNGLVSEHVVAISLLVLLMLISPMSKPDYRISTGRGRC